MSTQTDTPTPPAAGYTAASSEFQLEEVEAAQRGATFGLGGRPDPRGVGIATETAVRLAAEFPGDVVDWVSFRDEVTVVVRPQALVTVATFLRDVNGFALLSDISSCDWLDRREKRFSVSYHCTKLVPGAPRLRLQVWVDDGESVPSVIRVWPTADWHEREAYDLMGITFSEREGLRRILMPDDWVGHPQRKDYPMGGEPVKFTSTPREI